LLRRVTHQLSRVMRTQNTDHMEVSSLAPIPTSGRPVSRRHQCKPARHMLLAKAHMAVGRRPMAVDRRPMAVDRRTMPVLHLQLTRRTVPMVHMVDGLDTDMRRAEHLHPSAALQSSRV